MNTQIISRHHGFRVASRTSLELRIQDRVNYALHATTGFRSFLDDVAIGLNLLYNYLVVYKNDPMKMADSAERFMQGKIPTECKAFSYDLDQNTYVILYSNKVKTYRELIDEIARKYETGSDKTRDYIDAALKDAHT